MTVWTPSGQSPLSLDRGIVCPGDSLFHPGPPSPFSFHSPHLAFSKPSQAAQADMGQDGRGGVGRANKQVQVLLWDNTWGSGWSGPHQGVSLINSHTLAKGVNNGHRAAQQAERETLLSLSHGSVWSRGRPKRDGSGERGGDQRMPQPPVTSSSVSRIPHYLSFSFLSPIPPSSFSVSSDQIEQLHRRFKQLSGDQPTIR